MNDDQFAKEKFMQMSIKGKAAHIWEYYKIHIIIAVALIAAALSIINAVFINPAPKLFAGICLYGIQESDNFMKELSSSLTEAVVPEGENKEVRCSAFYESESDSTVGLYLGQKFDVLIMAKELDIIIADKKEFEDLVNYGYIVNLDEFLDTDFINGYAEKEMVLNGTNIEDSTKRPYGICIKNSSVISGSRNMNGDSIYMGFVRNSENGENSVKTFKEILK